MRIFGARFILTFMLATLPATAKTPIYPNSPNPAKWLEQKLIYFPDVGREFTPASTGLPLQDLYFRSEDGVKLNAWYLPAPAGAPTVLYLHGNGGNLCDEESMGTIKMYAQAGMGVLALDYRGFGLSEGQPHEQAVYADARAAYAECMKLGIKPRNLLIHGHSLGGAIAAHLANERPCAGLILESTFTTIPDMARKLYGSRAADFILSRFPTIDVIRHLTMPILVIHGVDDDFIPASMGQELVEAAPGPAKHLWLIEGGGHNDLESIAGSEFVKRVRAFAQECRSQG